MQINPYLVFNGQCEEAFKFYEKCLGGKIEAMMPHRECVAPGREGEPEGAVGARRDTLPQLRDFDDGLRNGLPGVVDDSTADGVRRRDQDTQKEWEHRLKLGAQAA